MQARLTGHGRVDFRQTSFDPIKRPSAQAEAKALFAGKNAFIAATRYRDVDYFYLTRISTLNGRKIETIEAEFSQK